ncbi:alpha/beta hydrolase [Marinitoga aeolica]|uniref:Alpha/beta hydrolase family protein n=1 Tax=Marinitoga aeolica TaxID=2809031 RepID=A0ABY8PPQ9_9BACT|nr:alpha/beta hydrolase family protein [Marinitoga aeolica]WGS64624.1 alpha/beta hydrolase family protein [Marinitoga aeolica]
MIFAKNYDDSPIILKEENRKTILKSNYPCEYPESSKIPLYIYDAKSDKTLLFIHGLGTRNLKYLKWFPENFAKNGYNSALMILPYHFDRTPKGHKSGELFLSTTDNYILRSRFEHSVVDILTTLNYLKERFKTDLYLMGFSFGGMVSTIAASLREDIKGLSLAVTGGNFYHITWKSFVTGVLRVQYEENKECNPEKCLNYHLKEYPEYLNSLKKPEIELDKAPIACFEYDPLTFAKFIKSPVIIFRALFDIFIPKKSTLDLYEKIKTQKELYTIPTGHLSSYLYRKYILKKTISFFKKRGEI